MKQPKNQARGKKKGTKPVPVSSIQRRRILPKKPAPLRVIPDGSPLLPADLGHLQKELAEARAKLDHANTRLAEAQEEQSLCVEDMKRADKLLRAAFAEIIEKDGLGNT